MMPLLYRLVPRTLKNRLIVMFLLFILFPFVLLSVYNFYSVEIVLERKVSEQDREQLLGMKRSLEDYSGIPIKIWTLFEQDNLLTDLLLKPESYDPIDRKVRMESKFNSLSNSFFLTGSQLYYTLLDMRGNVYTSYLPEQPLQYDNLIKESGFQNVLKGPERYLWVKNDPSYVRKDVTRSTHLASIYTVLKEKGGQYSALLRVSMDYEEWFQLATQNADRDRNGLFYALVDGTGHPVLYTGKNEDLPGSIASALSSNEGKNGTSWRDQTTGSLYTTAYIPSLDWYIVKGTPLDLLFAEVDRIKTRYYTALVGFMLLFAGVTAAVSSSVTRPIFQLQRKMEVMVANDLKAALPEIRSTVEIQSLTRSFNRMVLDIHDLINLLKLEERQKQAIRFQVLLNQMNPHFLLNTLNTVKSIALQNDQDEIHDICVSLGRILESSLNLDVDLIHLKEELGLVRAYMQIQNTRFGNRFDVEYALDPAMIYALVPKSSLQPLVENSIIHGFGQTAYTGSIRISAYSHRDQLVLEVTDNGIGLQAAAEKPKRRTNAGVGLTNLRERLILLYQDRATLDLEQLEQGTKAKLSLPFLLATPYEEEFK